MIDLFPKSRRIAWIGGIVLGIAGGILGWLLARGRLDTTGGQIAAAALAAFLGANLAIYAARITAMKEYQTRLLYLYEELDPERFLEALLPLRKARMSLSQRGELTAHLANGCLYAGDTRRALELLDEIEVPEKAREMRGLILSNRAACFLMDDRPEEAARQLEALRGLLRSGGCKKEFVEKTRHAIAYQELCMDIRRGKKIDPGVLQKDFSASRAPLHKLDVQYQLALYYRKRGAEEDFDRAREYVTAHGGKTVLPLRLMNAS